jgi:hypothetical protein
MVKSERNDSNAQVLEDGVPDIHRETMSKEHRQDLRCIDG